MISIRLANLSDLPAIHAIYNQAVEQLFCTAHLEPVSPQWHGEWFSRHTPNRYPVFVSEHQGSITGWVSIGPYREDRQALIHVAEVSYYVHKDYRRRGIGDALLSFAIKAAPEYGIEILVAILLNRNPPSIGILEKHGFSQWGCMPGIARIGKERADHLYYGLKLT